MYQSPKVGATVTLYGKMSRELTFEKKTPLPVMERWTANELAFGNDDTGNATANESWYTYEYVTGHV